MFQWGILAVAMQLWVDLGRDNCPWNLADIKASSSCGFA